MYMSQSQFGHVPAVLPAGTELQATQVVIDRGVVPPEGCAVPLGAVSK